MILGVKRFSTGPAGTFGRLTVDGADTGYTLEPPWNDGQNRHETDAILPGLYEVTINFSHRFQRLMPLLMAVPGRSAIRIHPGNTDKNTEGCLLVGQEILGPYLANSRAIFDPLFREMQDAMAAGEDVHIAISNAWNNPVAITVTEDAPQAQGG